MVNIPRAQSLKSHLMLVLLVSTVSFNASAPMLATLLYYNYIAILVRV